MIERIGKRKYEIYAIDFETHNDEESIKLGETGVWLGCLLNEKSKIDDENSYFYSVDELLNRLEIMSKPDTKHGGKKAAGKYICIYDFHLSFEWSFILPVLLEKGYRYKENISEDDEKVFNSISTKSVSSVWDIQLKINKGKSLIIFRDLNKIFNGTLRALAKSFNLETQKGDIDYTLNRRHGWIPTREEKEYCFKDVKIIVEILQHMYNIKDKDFWNSSSAASYAMRVMLRTGYPNSLRPLKEYRKDYPLLSKEENEFLRRGVAGGITYATGRWMFKDIKQKIIHIDAHNMHPSQAYYQKFPYGYGTYFKGKPSGRGISCCRIRISYTGVKVHSIIELIGLDFEENYELTVWDFEIPTMMKCYENLEIEYIDGYEYKAKMLPWRDFYADNYRKRLVAKQQKDYFNIMYYKLLNNSSYGKLLEKPHNEIYQNYINEDGIIDSLILNREEEQYNAKYTYLPVGSCIPAYSRVWLIETALKFGWEKIVYFDTDSIFVIGDEESEEVWKTLPQKDFLGNWGREPDILRGEFDAPKRYKILEEGEEYPTVHAAGLNCSLFSEVEWADIDLVDGKYVIQRGYRVKGGTIIATQLKQLQVQDKYKDIWEANYEGTN